MDTFFRRHFKRKDAAHQAPSDVTSCRQRDSDITSCRPRRPSVAVPGSKARRRSSAGLPSSALTRRRRSSLQLPPGAIGGVRLAAAGGGGRSRWGGRGRRRSSTTTPGANPRFAVSRRKVAKLRSIDTHLLGPSMLLASLIQMAEEDEDGVGAGLPAGEQQVEVRGGANNRRTFTHGGGGGGGNLNSDGDDSTDYSTTTDDSQSESSSMSEEEQLPEEEEEEEEEEEHEEAQGPASTPSCSSSALVMRKTPRPLIRAPRCLRRNSSQVCVGDSGPCRASSQRRRRRRRRRRRVSTISKAGSPWPGRGPPLPNRRSSVYYLNHPAFYRGPGALSPLGYDSRLESWSAFLLYVEKNHTNSYSL